MSVSSSQILEFGSGLFVVRGHPSEQLLSLLGSHFRQAAQGLSGAEPLATFEFKENGAEFDLLVDGKISLRAAPTPLVVQFLRSKVQSLLARSRSDLLFLRGEVLELRSGVGLLLAGPSFSGQTTLARALGGQMWSSHFAVLGSDGRARRYPQLDSESLPLALIATLRYRPGSNWSTQPLTPGPCALALSTLLEGDEGVIARALPALAAASSQASARLTGVRGEAEAAAQALRAYL